MSAISTMVNTLKEKMEENMFTQGKSEEEVEEWAKESEEMLAEADKWVRKITQAIRDTDLADEEGRTRQEEQQRLGFERRLTEQKLAQEREAADEKRRLEIEYQQRLKESLPKTPSPGTSTTAKMPKLIITKCNGTPQDWIRFWGQFEAQIDQSSVDAVTKFSYLKELVEVKVRKLIDGLSFTEEGYDKAKILLQRKYGETSEVIGAYVRSILKLPSVRKRDVAKIHNFYETLLYNVESLQTLTRL